MLGDNSRIRARAHMSTVQRYNRGELHAYGRTCTRTTLVEVYLDAQWDSHKDTTSAGKNCAIINCTDRNCDVAPFLEKYTPMKYLPILSAAAGFKSANGRNYILVTHEAFYMPDMRHTLNNPNQ